MTLDINHLRQWIGRVEDVRDVVTAAPLAGLQATLDRDDPAPNPGDPLPPSGHWLYFLPSTRQSDLDENGHAKKGDFLPPVPLERRMWAGGRIRFLADLHMGDVITRNSEILDVSLKEGNSGPLVFVVVRHRVSGPGGLAIEEEHDIVYRGAPPQGTPPTSGPVAAGDAVWQRTINPDPVLLFRYSALIFNGHRIHYDREYVTEKEGYPGLIVHGPLIATLLMDLCRREAPDRRLIRFDYRARGAIFDLGPFSVNGRPVDGGAELWALDHQGRLAMTGEAAFEIL
ncbi:MAG: acyl-CoA dehydrogenase [Alphaproteobacteria bacterium]|jgi:3-methylfumaryl-CoA hydratase|nr:acyl-CoA dehydrogenase [Alphaproteobacteria bacterium]MBT7941940.1 acyl-CoA dehydrogenase [Alphaproteobacteria bacterium]